MKAIAQLDKLRYSDEDCANGVDVRAWAMKFFNVAKAAGFVTTSQQLTQLYLHVSPSLRELVFKPNASMTKNEYLEHLKEKLPLDDPRLKAAYPVRPSGSPYSS